MTPPIKRFAISIAFSGRHVEDRNAQRMVLINQGFLRLGLGLAELKVVAPPRLRPGCALPVVPIPALQHRIGESVSAHAILVKRSGEKQPTSLGRRTRS